MDCAPLQSTVGSVFAYCQLLNQPIHTRPSLDGASFQVFVAEKSLPQSAQSAGVSGTSLVKVAPSKLPIRYRTPVPPAGAPGLRLMISTHFFPLVPSTGKSI